MTVPAQNGRYTVEEYFRLEETSEEKHEFWDGFIVPVGNPLAMAGGSYEHSLVTANFSRALGKRIEGGPCRVMSSDLRIRGHQSPFYVYPDASVICGPPRFDPQDAKRGSVLNPRVVVEVLSPSTEAFDRKEKFRLYLQIESIEEILLVSQNEPRIEAFFRGQERDWLFAPVEGMGSSLKLRSMGAEVPLAEIYLDVEFPPVRYVLPG